MKRLLIFALLAALLAASSASAKDGEVLAVKFDADVNPVTQGWLSDRIKEGANYDALVILLTPRRARLVDAQDRAGRAAAKEPVIVYVAERRPRRERGVWISQAADVGDVARVEHRLVDTDHEHGANLDSDLKRKVVNDAAASLRNLARVHGGTRSGPTRRCAEPRTSRQAKRCAST